MFDMFYKQEAEIARLDKLKKKFKTAKRLNLNKCNKCGFCCHQRTCIPTPAELKMIAKFFKLTPVELINKFYAIDKQSFKDDYYVKPIGINQKDLRGKFIPTDRTYGEGKCIFLRKNNLCTIYSVRPQAAKRQKCWDNTREKGDFLSVWKNDVLKKEFGFDGRELEYN